LKTEEDSSKVKTRKP